MRRSKPSVFLLEDDSLVLLEIQKDLEELGWQVDHAARNLEEAKKLAPSADIDLAILDINVGGVRSYPVAEIFKHRGIPLIFITGFIGERIRTDYPGASILSKPYSFVDLQFTVRHALLVAPANLSSRNSASAPSKRD